ncbi:rho GTPase-activating protein 40 isoform X2 [Syngnathus scovelli]|uniref:rho GTPase-activating protein 40 isoform X2 n=1 Tax=Syngnathus scovelli TaxID=161590 RepID=UPI00210F88CC|nr:rho GTPase-activating protein 40 isoform X2 [Syngnathus scovelli]
MGGREEVMVTRVQEPTMQFSRWKPMRVIILKTHKVHSKKSRDPSPTEMSAEPWASPQDRAAAEHSAHTLPPSQDQHPDEHCLTFWEEEVENIRLGGGLAEPESIRRDSRQSEEGEQEEWWLNDAGLSPLISEDSADLDGGLLSTLTPAQSEAVQRRVNTYTMSLRKRNKTAPRHVRDIFDTPIRQGFSESQHSEELTQNTRASVSKTSRSAPREEFFYTDVAYCEQAAASFNRAQMSPNNIQERKEDATLPRVIHPKCRLGVTRIQDLSHADMKKVRQLALIDMTALCDLIGLEVKRHKTAKRKMSESPLFGVPLATLLENDQKVKMATTIPLFLQEILTFLEKRGVDSEGILRVPGSMSRIKLLQQNLEANFYTGQVKWDEVSPNDAAALLKKFIRELPAPLLTAEYLNTFSAVRDITELKQKLHVLNLLILLLPEANRNTLKALLEFLSKVVSQEKRNRMNLWAVATIMAPNLFLHKAVPSRLTEGAEKGLVEKAADVMRLLICYQDLLWTIPIFVMNQVRKLNENNSRRYHFKNLLRKSHTESKEKPEKNTSEARRTVKIYVGDQISGRMNFQMNKDSRASDLLTQFYQQFILGPETGKGQRRRNGSVPYSEYTLYEVGGNIGEHRLDPDTHLLDLYNSNSGGEWVLKIKQHINKSW